MVHTPVKGYKEQSDEIIGLVNRNKIIEERVLRIMDSIRNLGTDIDQRWLSIGRTHIEQGFMAINRALFQPERIATENLVEADMDAAKKAALENSESLLTKD